MEGRGRALLGFFLLAESLAYLPSLVIALNYKIYSVEKESFSIDSYIPHFKTVSQTEKITLKLNPIYYFDSKSFELSFENEKSVVEIVDLNAQITRYNIVSSTLNCSVLLRYFYLDESSELCYFEKEETYSLKLNDIEMSGEAGVSLVNYDFVISNTNKINLEDSNPLYKALK